MKKTEKEKSAQEKRKTNIIISGLKPGVSESDSTLVRNLAQSLGVSLEQNVVTQRVGKVNDDGCQLLRVDVKTETIKWQLIGKSKNLLNFDNYRKVYINPDLTADEQKVAFELRQRLKKARSEKPNASYRIKKGEIIESA